MPGSDPSLLARIEQDLIDGSVTTTAILNKCILLAARSGSQELRDWARRELHGYSGESDELPAYREIHAQICIDGQVGPALVTGHGIDAINLPGFVSEAGIGKRGSRSPLANSKVAALLVVGSARAQPPSSCRSAAT